MDAVNAFNNELSALYEVKPPISKAKMSSITRSAIKAIKLYKHVVQSVEKFIQKCKPEYKVPGLYVIDSIVRQSRHQFGPDKDVFAPRFSKNMQNTFANLFSCPPEDKGKIIRVLNLWQKNSVFTPDVIQPLFDQLADRSNPIHRDNITSTNGLVVPSDHTSPSNASKSSALKKSGVSSGTDGGTPHWVKLAQLQIDAANKAIFELTGSNVAQSKSSSNSSLDILHQIQQLQQFIVSQTNQSNQKQERSQSDQVVFDKKLLDFDYDDDEENTSPHHQPNSDNFNYILQNPEILKQLTALQQQMSQYQLRQQQVELEEKMRKLKEMKRQEEEFDKHLAQTVPKLPFASECDLKQYQDSSGSNSLPDLSVPPPGYSKHGYRTDAHDLEVECIEDKSSERDRKVEVINLLERSPSSSPSQTGNRRRHSRSRSRDRRRSRRSRSRSSRSRSRSLRPKRKRRSRSRSRDHYLESEKERERRKKGLPPIKKNHLSGEYTKRVRAAAESTTLWVGHLSKLVQPEELSDTFGECGDVVSIDVIPPRGCAFICMNRRQDAARALVKLKDQKLQGKSIMLAWAPGKGVKDRNYKDYWEIELGVSYIPWSRLKKDTDFAALEEGGAIDEDTIPEDLKDIILQQLQKKKNEIDAESKLKALAAPGFIPLPEGISVPSVPPVLAAALPAVMTVPPPAMGASNSPAAPPIDTSQPPPNMSPGSNGGVPVPVALPRIPVLAKPGIMMPPFPFTSLPPPLGLGVPNMISNLPISVPPPPPGLLMQQQLMAIPTSGASAFQTGTIIPPMPVTEGSSDKMESGYDPHPLQGQPLGMSNHKAEETMDDEGEDEKSKAKARSPRDRDKSSNDRSRDDGRRRDDDRRDDRDRDKDKNERERDRRKDRERRRRRSRERDRSRGHERDFRNRSRENDRRRDRDRSEIDRSRGKSRDRERSSDDGKGKRDDPKKEPVNQWVEVPLSTEEKPSLLQRLRNIAEGGGDPSQMSQMFAGPPARMPEPGNRHGLPIVINFNNSGLQRPGFVPRGPMIDVFRPEFGARGPLDFGPRGGFGDGMPPNDGYNPRGRGPMDQSDRSRGRFDMSAPRPLMETHFEGHPLIPDDIRGSMIHEGMRGPMMHPDDLIHPDEMRGSIYDDPRMRFGPRNMMGPLIRGPMGPHGPGLVPLYGPRGPRPPHGRVNIWMDNQGPPTLGDNYIRPPFDRRGPGPNASGPRFRPDRLRDRQTRSSKDDAKEGVRNESGKKYDEEDKSENAEPTRDTQTPCHDEKPIVEQDDTKQIHNEPIDDANRTKQSEPPEEYERDAGTPCHDEPEVPNIVVQGPDHRFTQISRIIKAESKMLDDEEKPQDMLGSIKQEAADLSVRETNEDLIKTEDTEA